MSFDRRRHKRVRLHGLLSMDVLARQDEGAAASEMACELRDLSESGARLEAPAWLASGTDVTLGLLLQDAAGGEVYLEPRGSVRWAQKIEPDGPYEVGLEFTSLTSEEELLLRNYAEHHPLGEI